MPGSAEEKKIASFRARGTKKVVGEGYFYVPHSLKKYFCIFFFLLPVLMHSTWLFDPVEILILTLPDLPYQFFLSKVLCSN